MNKMECDGDKCQLPDSDPKTQPHTDVVGGEAAQQQAAHAREAGVSKLTEILVDTGWLPQPARTNSGGFIKGPVLRMREATAVRPEPRVTRYSALPLWGGQPTGRGGA